MRRLGLRSRSVGSGRLQRASDRTKGGEFRHGSCWWTHGKTIVAPTAESVAMRRASLTGRCTRSTVRGSSPPTPAGVLPERVSRVDALRCCRLMSGRLAQGGGLVLPVPRSGEVVGGSSRAPGE